MDTVNRQVVTELEEVIAEAIKYAVEVRELSDKIASFMIGDLPVCPDDDSKHTTGWIYKIIRDIRRVHAELAVTRALLNRLVNAGLCGTTSNFALDVSGVSDCTLCTKES